MDENRAARRTATALPIEDLAERLSGGVVTPADESDADARRVWNGLVNEYPAAVAYCERTADVAAVGD